MAMPEPLADQPDHRPPAGGAEDYARVKRAIEFVHANWREQPSLSRIAAHVGLSPGHFHQLFTRWAGLSPKAFVQALTLAEARVLLRRSASVLDAALETGLSGPGRLHDLFVEYEAMTPGEYKRRGEGLDIAYGWHDSPFGMALIAATARGVCGLSFCDDATQADERLAQMMARWPGALYAQAPETTAVWAARIFPGGAGLAQARTGLPVRLHLIGTDFELRVWQDLIAMPAGRVTSYAELAARTGAPKAARAVGRAVGRNPVAFVVPCHRVVRADGRLGGYHWGVTRKRAILGWEWARRGEI
jgi:AraC family transcriptional regulator of adaptative response/methylated-DNA-[protein]-cysteine methyltransferase